LLSRLVVKLVVKSVELRRLLVNYANCAFGAFDTRLDIQLDTQLDTQFDFPYLA